VDASPENPNESKNDERNKTHWTWTARTVVGLTSSYRSRSVVKGHRKSSRSV